jgi:hypothetical protein
MLKLRMLAWCSAVEYFLFICGSNWYVAAVVAYLASEDVVLGHGCVSVFILVWAVKGSFRGCWFWYLHVLGVRSWYTFFVSVLSEEGNILRSFSYLCRNSHPECGCKLLVNLMVYLSSDGCCWNVVDWCIFCFA